MYVCMKPAWNYLYEIKVSCGKNNSPSLVGVGYVARHSHRFLFIPGSCVELLTNSGRGDHALHQSCLPVATQNSPCWTRLRKDVPEWGEVQKLCLQGPGASWSGSWDAPRAGPGADLATGK